MAESNLSPARKPVKRVSLIGKKFGKLTVVGQTESSPNRNARRWFCRCDCGGSRIATTVYLNAKRPIQSCGCRNEECRARCLRPRSPQRPNEYVDGEKYTIIRVVDPDGSIKGEIRIDTADRDAVRRHHWRFTKAGYVSTTSNYKKKMLHHLITGTKFIDHKDGDPKNNTRENLRPADNSQNQANRRKGIGRSDTGPCTRVFV